MIFRVFWKANNQILLLLIMDCIHLINRLVQQHATMVKEPIRAYVRLYPSAGIDPIQNDEYEILDGKTFLDKRNEKKSVMHPFNYIFTNEFQYCKQIQHMNIIDDCLDGKDQIIIADINKQLVQSFMLGTAEDPGFVISVFQALFNQTYYQTTTQQSQHNISKQSTKQQSISISIFSSEDNSNKFIDLILGQKFTFYSKKDMDEYKDFYDKQILTMRQFLIVLKIALLRYKQCCIDGDPIVFRIVADSFDQVKNRHFSSTIHIVICESESKIINSITRKIEFSLKNTQLKGQDHGSLANYLEKHFRKTKLIYVYGIPYRNGCMQNSVQMFQFLNLLKNHSYQFDRSIVDLKIKQKMTTLNHETLKRYRYGTHVFNHKEISQATKLMERLCSFMNETQLKWKNYCQLFAELLQLQQDFYERQRFPISLQIQEFNVKSFLISKVYKLSQTYQMDDQNYAMQKLRTLKNQVIISLKAIAQSKQLAHLSNSKNAHQFIKYYHQCMDLIAQKVKEIFGIRYRNVQTYGIRLDQEIKIQTILDNKLLKEAILKFKNQAKKIKEKQQILLRKLDLQNIDPGLGNVQNNKIVQYTNRSPQLNGTKTFQLFRKARRMQNLSELPSMTEPLKSLKNSQIKSPYKQQYEYSPLQNSSIIITRQSEQNNYNFSLPKIAVIHRKKVKKF